MSEEKRSRSERAEEERKRRERVGVRAEEIVRTMPNPPRVGDIPSVQSEMVARYRTWVEHARRQVGGDADLADRVMEQVKNHLGLSNPDPARAARTARDLLSAGMGDVGMSRRAREILDRTDTDPSVAAAYLVEQYVRVWTEIGAEIPVGVEIHGALLVTGQRDALRINVWVADEPGTLPVVRTIRETEL